MVFLKKIVFLLVAGFSISLFSCQDNLLKSPAVPPVAQESASKANDKKVASKMTEITDPAVLKMLKEKSLAANKNPKSKSSSLQSASGVITSPANGASLYSSLGLDVYATINFTAEPNGGVQHVAAVAYYNVNTGLYRAFLQNTGSMPFPITDYMYAPFPPEYSGYEPAGTINNTVQIYLWLRPYLPYDNQNYTLLDFKYISLYN